MLLSILIIIIFYFLNFLNGKYYNSKIIILKLQNFKNIFNVINFSTKISHTIN